MFQPREYQSMWQGTSASGNSHDSYPRAIFVSVRFRTTLKDSLAKNTHPDPRGFCPGPLATPEKGRGRQASSE